MGEELRLCSGNIRELLLQDPGHTGVQLLAPALEQAGVGGVLHQRVLEDVDRVRRLAARKTSSASISSFQRRASSSSGSGATAASSP